ncbi:MAG TPA: hypothetical protein VI078_14690, partial [bacterium]
MNGPARPPEATSGPPGALPACSAGLAALAVVLWRALPALIGQPLAPLVLVPALMSTAAGGLVPCLAPRRIPAEAVPRQLGRLSLALALALCAQPGFFFALARVAPLAGWFLAQTPQPRPVALAALCVVVAAPFFVGGWLVALALADRRADAGRAWAGVLAGGAIGALVALVVVPAVASGGAVEIPYAGGRRESGALLARWGVSSRVLVRPLRGDEAATALALGGLHSGPLPEQLGLVVDDVPYANVVRHRAGDESGWEPASLAALAHGIRRDPRVLVVGAGGGSDVLVARALGDGPIRAVEPDALVVRVVEEDLAGFSGRPFSLAGVEAVVADGRAFLRRDPSAYDLILAPGAPGLPRLLPSGGDRLATREAFGELLARLAPDGLLSRRFSAGERPLLRFVATARAALEDAGAEAPWAHLFIAAAGDVANMIVKRSPFTVGEVAVLEARCRGLGFEVVYSPAREGAGAIARFVRAEDPVGFLAGLSYDATPVGDDRPFLLRQLRPRDLFLGGSRGAGTADRALVAVRNLLCIALVPALAAALVPLRRRAPSDGVT